jgi:hypothetical protein
MGQAARLVVHDVLDGRAGFSEVEHFVHLLLVFGERKAQMRFLDEVADLVGRSVRVGRHGVTAEHSRSEHAHVEVGAVVAEHEQGVFAAKTHALQARSAGQRCFEHLRPGGFLPNAQVFFTHGNAVAEHFGIAREDANQRGVGLQIPGRGVLFSALHGLPPGRLG